MSKLKTLFTKLVSPEVRTLSNEGKEELINLLFLEKKADLVKVAQEMLDEAKKEKECK